MDPGGLLVAYIDFVARILRRLEIRSGPDGFSVGLKEEAERSADERIALIDAARANLAQGIHAIDELRVEAERNKREVEATLAQLASLAGDKLSLERQREEVQKLVSADIAAFQKLAGVPSRASIRRERVIGFFSGVLASVVASGIIWGVAKLAGRLGWFS